MVTTGRQTCHSVLPGLWPEIVRQTPTQTDVSCQTGTMKQATQTQVRNKLQSDASMCRTRKVLLGFYPDPVYTFMQQNFLNKFILIVTQESK